MYVPELCVAVSLNSNDLRSFAALMCTALLRTLYSLMVKLFLLCALDSFSMTQLAWLGLYFSVLQSSSTGSHQVISECTAPHPPPPTAPGANIRETKWSLSAHFRSKPCTRARTLAQSPPRLDGKIVFKNGLLKLFQL